MAFAIGWWFHRPHCLWVFYFFVKTNWVRDKKGETAEESGIEDEEVTESLSWNLSCGKTL